MSTILRHTYVQYTYEFLGPGKRRPRYVRVLYLSTGEVNEGDFVLNREKHPVFDATNCVQGTYVM